MDFETEVNFEKNFDEEVTETYSEENELIDEIVYRVINGELLSAA